MNLRESGLLALGLSPITIEIVQHASDFFGIASPEGKALFVNDAGRQIFGLGESADISHLTMLDFIAQREHAVFASEFVQPALSGANVHKEISVRRLDTQEVFSMDLSLFVNRDDQNQPLCFMAFGKDLRNTVEIQELLASIQDRLKVGGWQLDVATGRAIWSAKVYELHGIPFGTDVAKVEAINFYAPHDRERIQHYVNACITFGESYDDEFEFINALGEQFWIRTTGAPVYDDDGNIIKIRGIFQDIDEQKRLRLENEQATAELELFRALAENSPDFIGMADNNNQPIYLNPAGRQMIGLPLSADISKVAIADCYPARIRKEILSELIGTMERDGSFSGETLFRHVITDAEIPVLDKHFLLIDSRTGERLGHATITRDISPEIELRKSLEQEREKLAQAAKLASLGELAAGVAHEINNPLTVISGSTSLIRRAGDNRVRVAQYTEKIDKSVARITSIVNGLRKYSRASTSTVMLPTDLNAVITEAIELVTPKARNNNHALHFEPDSPHLIGRCDEIQIEQVIINLLTNAIDANRDRENSWTRIYSRLVDDMCEIVVQDSGTGIEPAIANKLFDPFFTTKEVGAGTGLGLSISSGIVSNHAGKLEYTVRDGHTAFILKLPAASAY